MKRFLTMALCLLLAVSMLFVGGCGENKDTASTDGGEKVATLKFGSGVYVSQPAATDATADKEGTGKVDVTVAAVTVDADGKAVANEEFKTKYEQGKEYNMVAYGGAKKEWFEQVDAFEAFVAGKTLKEVKALVADENKGNDDVINAGCTIMIHEFVGAIEKAYNAAADSKVTAKDTLKVTAATEQTCTDVTAEKDGSNKVSTTVFAAAVDADGKVVAAASDCVEVAFTFNNKGASTFDATKAVLSKKEQGADYGMVAYAGSAKEWFEQAAAFDAACIGKTASEIAGLQAEDGKGVADLQKAGCTIYVTGFVKAASKI